MEEVESSNFPNAYKLQFCGRILLLWTCSWKGLLFLGGRDIWHRARSKVTATEIPADLRLWAVMNSSLNQREV
jgi:hypothetical protein